MNAALAASAGIVTVQERVSLSFVNLAQYSGVILQRYSNLHLMLIYKKIITQAYFWHCECYRRELSLEIPNFSYSMSFIQPRNKETMHELSFLNNRDEKSESAGLYVFSEYKFSKNL